uniref:RCC1 and BTB domain-containing protein 1-like n=1 Tax=Dermatophagoides pteronyssinus TaxID=6956 RepID=A0A6P6YJF3_DERPT|nr:RCC1 and BTB domain-containing protein 1-like [Dermatophagoides pteronyssinus]
MGVIIVHCTFVYGLTLLLNIVNIIFQTFFWTEDFEPYYFLEEKIMKKSSTIDIDVDIDLFQNDLKHIEQEFIGNIVSIFKISTLNKDFGFLFIINDDDSIYAYGCEICKWLSLQHDPKQPQKIEILNDKKIIQIDSGDKFIVVLTDDGQVYLASSDDSEWQTNNTFRLISTGDDHFEMIACGQNYFLLLRKDGTVFALGDNEYGQLTNDTNSYDNLVDTGLKNVEIIACGGGHSLALTDTNQIYSWGCNKYGQLGLGDENDRNIPTLVSFPDGSIDSPIKNIVAGAVHSLFVFDNGQMFGCGLGQHPMNDSKQDASVPTKIPIENVQSVACKNYLDFSLIMDQSLQYYVWGKVKNEESLFLSPPKKLCGQPKSFASASAISCRSPITYGLTSTIHAFESNDTISFMGLLDNPDNYDVEFIIGDKRILALKFYLRMVSKYYSRMFSGEWKDNNKIIINSFSYDAYYSYLRKLHNGHIRINLSNIVELIDLANCFEDERLMMHCRTFIRNNLNKRTLFIYLPLIDKYELDEMHAKLVELIIDDVLPKISKNFLENKKNITKFLLWFFEQ